MGTDVCPPARPLRGCSWAPDLSPCGPGTGSPKEVEAVSSELFAAFKDIGFVTLTNHGMDPSLIANTFELQKKFFALPYAEKHKLKWTTPEANRGYLGVGMEQLYEGKPDLKETFEIGHEADVNFRNPWPEESVLPGFRKAMLTFFYRADEIHLQVLRSIAIHLKLPSPTFGTGNYFTPLCNKNHQNLRLLHYPACKRSEIGSGLTDTKRAGEHTDYGSITMVFQEKWGGLEVRNRQNEWKHVEPVKDAIVINIADCLQRWSNDTLRSTRHRVTTDPRVTGTEVPARFSIAFFCNPNKETLVDALPGTFDAQHPKKYPPINAFDYLIGRLNATIET